MRQIQINHKKEKSVGVWKRAERIPVVLIGEGLLVGVIGGFVVLLYRVALTCAGGWLNDILSYIKDSPLKCAVWFAVLAGLAVIVGKLVKWEPMISGSGIPQVEGEVGGRLEQNWQRVLPAKFFGGFLCMLGGLSLGREGPSIQLGAMAGQGISRCLGRSTKEEKYLMTCGASAGLAAAFHAPLAGMMFAVEEIHKGFSLPILIPVMTASVTADYISSYIMGIDPVFRFGITEFLPQDHYWMLILLGITVGFLGVFYNRAMLEAQRLYKKGGKLGVTGRLMVAFMTAGVLGILMPSVLGSGGELIVTLTEGRLTLSFVLATLIVKFLFSGISFGSGAPGGIFFPLLILGALIGAAFAMTGVELFGMNPVYINNFVLLGMVGYFTAIVRAPLTGVILLFEMSGSVSQMLSMSIVSVTAYIVATLMKSEPIYDSLLKRILKADE